VLTLVRPIPELLQQSLLFVSEGAEERGRRGNCRRGGILKLVVVRLILLDLLEFAAKNA
jgi:hypothetical protein